MDYEVDAGLLDQISPYILHSCLYIHTSVFTPTDTATSNQVLRGYKIVVHFGQIYHNSTNLKWRFPRVMMDPLLTYASVVLICGISLLALADVAAIGVETHADSVTVMLVCGTLILVWKKYVNGQGQGMLWHRPTKGQDTIWHRPTKGQDTMCNRSKPIRKRSKVRGQCTIWNR